MFVKQVLIFYTQACGLQATGARVNNLATVSEGLEKRRLSWVCRGPPWTLGQTEDLVLVAWRAIALDWISLAPMGHSYPLVLGIL